MAEGPEEEVVVVVRMEMMVEMHMPSFVGRNFPVISLIKSIQPLSRRLPQIKLMNNQKDLKNLDMKTLSILFLGMVAIITTPRVSAQNVSVDANQFIIGKETLPKSAALALDTVLFFDRDSARFYAGVLGDTLTQYLDIDSLGFGSTGFGYNTFPKGLYSMSLGALNQSNAVLSNTAGLFLTNNTYGSFVVGSQNDPIDTTITNQINGDSPMFTVGNGGSFTYFGPHNALTSYADGRLEINQAYTLPPYDGDLNQVLVTDGNGALTWEDNVGVFESENGVIKVASNFNQDFIIGDNELPSTGTTIDRLMFFDESKGAFRTGYLSFSDNWNTDSLGNNSFATGEDTKALGRNAAAFGFESRADAYGSVSIGRYNIGGGNSAFWSSGDPVLEVGIGSNINNRSNALTILKNGTVSFKMYIFPNMDGDAEEVLTTDGNGQLTWAENLDIFEKTNTTVRVRENDDSDFLFGATFIPDSSKFNDQIFFFDESKATFRAGAITGNRNWSPDSIGLYSLARAHNTRALKFG
jgi:hypothetical protein